MLYILCNLGLVFTAIITSTFITIVTGKLRMFKIVAVMAKAIFSLSLLHNYLMSLLVRPILAEEESWTPM